MKHKLHFRDLYLPILGRETYAAAYYTHTILKEFSETSLLSYTNSDPQHPLLVRCPLLLLVYASE